MTETHQPGRRTCEPSFSDFVFTYMYLYMTGFTKYKLFYKEIFGYGYQHYTYKVKKIKYMNTFVHWCPKTAHVITIKAEP